MEINNLLTNFIRQNLPKDVLRENSTFQGEIIDIQGDIILLDIPGKGIIQAESKLDLEQLLGENIKFIVESKVGDKIEIKPLIEEALSEEIKEMDGSISKVLKEFNIKETDLSKNLIKNLMKYDVPLKSETLNEAVKTLDKLVQLSEIKDDEGLLFIDKEGHNHGQQNIDSLEARVNIKGEESLIGLGKNQDDYQDDLGNDLKVNEQASPDKDSEMSLGEKDISSRDLSGILDELPPIKKELTADIKNIILSSGGKEDEIELGQVVKDILREFNIENDEKDFLNIISFLTKNKIKPTLNNIKNLKELMDDPLGFSEEFNLLEDDKSLKGLKFIKKDGRIILEDDGEKTKNISDKQVDKKSMEKLGTKDRSSGKMELIGLKEKTQFMKDLNRDMYFHFIPINYGEENLNGLINVIKERKSKGSTDDNINIFISLDTKNLGNITVSCQAKDENLSIKVGIQDKDLELFKAGEDILRAKIGVLGYNISKLEFLTGGRLDISEGLISNSDPMHFLDIKV